MRTIKQRLQRTFELQDPTHARLLPMEGLRGFAVTLVFLQHYTVQAQLIGLHPGISSAVAAAFRDYGNLGVELFFVLSGFLIYGTLLRKKPRFIDFMARRFRRIYPTFLCVFILALALAILTPGANKIPQGLLHGSAYLAANLALLPGLIPMVRIVDVAWSLSYELFFYFLIAIVILWTPFGSLGRQKRIAILALVAAMFIGASYTDIPGFPIRMMPFFAGMFLAEGVGANVPPWLGWAAPIAAFSASVEHAMPGATGEVVHTVAFFLLCAVCFRGAGSVSACMTWTPLRWLGNMSYSYYLIHGFVVRIAMVALARLLPSGMPDWLFWTFAPLLYLATLVVSTFLFVGVEKPISLRPEVSRGAKNLNAGVV